jgi:hypothetical protein
MKLCQVPGCTRPGFWDEVCTAHHFEAHHAYGVKVLQEVKRDLQIEDALPELPAPTGKLKIHKPPAAWQTYGGTPYGRKVLATQVTKVAQSTHPGRNEILNRAAFVVGGYVAGGEIALEYATTALLEAARLCGLPRREAKATVRSGLRKGMAKPLMPPQKAA